MHHWLSTLVLTATCLLVAGPISSPTAAGVEKNPRRLLVQKSSSRNAVSGRLPGRDPARRIGQGSTTLGGWSILDVPEGETIDAFARRLRREGSFQSIEVDRLARISPRVPDDLHQNQWALQNVGQIVSGTRGLYDADIDAPEAWELETGNDSVIVAVLDTGVGRSNADLAGNVLPGIDFIEMDGDPDDDAGAGHGTPVAGIIGALGNNGVGMSGINWAASILPVKVCDGNGYCPYSAIISGIDEAVRRGARVINLSVTCDEHTDEATGSCGGSRPGSCYSQALKDTIEAAGRAGVLVVVAAGNCGEDVDDATSAYPCAYNLDNLICVGATDSSDEVAPFSNRGPRSVHIGAPGTRLVSLSTDPDALQLWDGTSFAAPMVSGVAGLQLSRNSNLTAAALKQRLIQGEERAGLKDAFSGGMRLNAYESVHDVFLSPVDLGAAAVRARHFTGDFDGDGLVDAGSILRNGALLVARGNGAGFESPAVWHVPGWGYAPFAGDINGDGKDDLVLSSRRGRVTLLSAGSMFTPEPPIPGNSRRRSSVLSDLKDVNGDGRADMIFEERFAVLVSISSGREFSRPVRWHAGLRGHRVFGDLNGDGRADLIIAADKTLLVALSDGSRFGPASVWEKVAIDRKMLTGDVNGDGLVDLAVSNEDCWDVLLSNGSAFTTPRPWACGGAGSFSSLTRLDSDSRADLLRIESKRWTLSRSTP